MDKFIIHAATIPRLHPAPMRLLTAALSPQKKGWVDHPFQTMNFSFILEGEGEYHFPEGRFSVKAPCVITQSPGVHVRYGPTTGTWAEMYFVFEPDAETWALASNLVHPRKRAWPCEDGDHLKAVAAELAGLADRAWEPGVMDQVDRICEGLVVSSLVGSTVDQRSEQEQAIGRILQQVRASFLEDQDWELLGEEEGFSPASFRRHWNRYIGVSPHKYVIGMRMRHACRLLVDTEQDVGEVGLASGFQDRLYFSRCFRKEVGITPSRYRREHRR